MPVHYDGFWITRSGYMLSILAAWGVIDGESAAVLIASAIDCELKAGIIGFLGWPVGFGYHDEIRNGARIRGLSLLIVGIGFITWTGNETETNPGDILGMAFA